MKSIELTISDALLAVNNMLPIRTIFCDASVFVVPVSVPSFSSLLPSKPADAAERSLKPVISNTLFEPAPDE